MKEKRKGTTRREILFGSAAAGASLALGFTRPAAAQESGERISQIASFGFDASRKDEVVATLSTLCQAVEENEPGVLAYICHFTEEETPQVFFFEIYENQKALEAHGGTPHLAKLREAFGSGLFQPPVKITKLDRVAGFFRS